MSNGGDEDDWLEGGEGAEESSADADVDSGRTKGEVVTKARLAVLVGKAPMTIDRMMAEGAPCIERGSKRSGWKINTAAFVDWMVRRAVMAATGNTETMGMDAAKRRDKEAQARMREFDLAERERQTISRVDAIEIYTDHVGEFRKRLFEMPGQVPDLSHEQRAAMETALNAALVEFSGLPEAGE